jgi:hypothetical protein
LGLLADTISDARRPLDGWVRRSAADEPDAGAPDEETGVDSAPPGIQTIYRFQKEGPVRSREASFQFGGGSNRSPAGDPLSAEGEAGRLVPTAKSVGITDISVKGDSRGSSLETGQEERASPSKIAAAGVVSASIPVQSDVSPVPVEAESSRAVQYVVPDGSEPTVSESGETFGSRLTGRGAPSETYRLPPRDREYQPAEPAAHPARAAARGAAKSVAGSGQSETRSPMPAGAGAGHAAERFAEGIAADGGGAAGPSGRQPTSPSGLGIPDAPARSIPGEARPAMPREPAAHAPFGPAKPNPATVSIESEPRLVIGRIDVVVLARETPKPATAAADEQRGFLSRNYLKRL